MAFKSKEAERRYQAAYRAAHREKARAATKAWREKNPDGFRDWSAANPKKVRAQRERFKERRPDYMREWLNARRKVDPQYRIQNSLRVRIWQALRGRRKPARFIELSGCTVADLVRHIEQQWTVGMSWQTYGVMGWHIDHIVPVSAFNLTDPEQAARAFHYMNLQPLWWHDNLAKGDKGQHGNQ
jgi:hypothetical protein